MKIKLFAILLSIMLVLNTIPANATALVPAVTGEAVAALAGTAVEANIIASLLSNGFNLDFSNYSGSSDEFFQSLTFQNFTTDMITSDIIGLQEKYGHDYDEILDWLLEQLGGSVESEVVPYKPWSRNLLERAVINLADEDLPDPEPTYPVSDEERTLASMILNRSLYVITYGEYLNNLPGSPFFWSISGSWYYYMTAQYPLRLFYNTSSRSISLYRFYNNTWELYNTVTYYPGLSYYGNFWMGNSVYSTLPHFADKQPNLGTYSSTGSYVNQFNTGAYNTNNVSLLTALISCVGNFDGVPVYVGSDFVSSLPIIPETPLPSIIGFGQGGTIETPSSDKPIVGVYPPQTFINIRPFIDLIIAAINNKSVLTFEDIKPLIVDVNGQQAIATVQIVRTDYDILFDEQYDDLFPRPNFSTNNDSMRAVVSLVPESAKIIEYVEVVPSSVMLPVVGCGIILLFALVLRRMLD